MSALFLFIVHRKAEYPALATAFSSRNTEIQTWDHGVPRPTAVMVLCGERRTEWPCVAAREFLRTILYSTTRFTLVSQWFPSPVAASAALSGPARRGGRVGYGVGGFGWEGKRRYAEPAYTPSAYDRHHQPREIDDESLGKKEHAKVSVRIPKSKGSRAGQFRELAEIGARPSAWIP